MRSVRLGPRSRSVYRVVVMGLSGLFWLAACKKPQTPLPQPATERVTQVSEPRPTPAPHFRSIDSASFVEVMAYVRGLRFDTAASGLTRLGGTVVVWSPEIGAGGITDDGLARGRIIARAQARGTLASFGSRAVTGYIWVDSVATDWRAILLPDDSTIRRSLVPMRMGTRRFPDDHHYEMRVLSDSFPNGRCGTRCCPFFGLAIEITPALLERISDYAHR